jgi:para-nitrobenzyl esterase
MFACNTRQQMQWMGAMDTVFAYQFDDQTAPQLFQTGDFAWKAYHGSELQYLSELFADNGVVPGVGTGVQPAFTPAQWQLADQMIAYWTTFARNGTPGGTSPSWAAYAPASDNILSFVPGATAFTSGYDADHKCDAWVGTGLYQ